MRSFLLALMITVGVVAVPSAQSAPDSATGFSGINVKRSIIVVDDVGKKTQGDVLRFTPDQLTMMVRGTEVSVDRRNVAAVYERGDSVVNGMVLGLLGGAALGWVALGNAPVGVGSADGILSFFALSGLGIGTAVDALIPAKRLIYERAAVGGSRKNRDPLAASNEAQPRVR